MNLAMRRLIELTSLMMIVMMMMMIKVIIYDG